jgi:hypothetical protein
MADKPPEGGSAEEKKRKPGTFAPGQSGNPGGVPKWRREIEQMLNDEHRTPEQMRETFALIRKVAHGVEEPVYYKGEVCGAIMKYDGGWMQMYLDRVLGPVRDTDIDLSNAPDSVVRWWAEEGPGSN